MADVFISYCREDSDFAEIVRGRLKDAGFTTWLDVEGLRAGMQWGKAIDHAINRSFALIVILSPASLRSAYVAYEWAFALGAGVEVIPILLKPVRLDPPLAELHYLDFSEKQARPWEKLQEILGELAEARPVNAVDLSRTTPPIVKEAVAALDNPDKEAMESAVKRLAEMDLPEAKDALVAALKHPLPEVRIEVADKLADKGDVRALPGLLELYRRGGSWTFGLANRLGRIGLAAVPALLPYLKDENSIVREVVVGTLGDLGDSSAVPEIISLLNDPELQVRVSAAIALKEIGTPEARAALEASIPEWARIMQRGGRDAMKAREALTRIDVEKAWMALLSSEEPNSRERADALKKLVASDTPEAMAAVKRVLELWIKRDIQEGSWWVRATLEEIGTGRARELLAQFSPPGRKGKVRIGARKSRRARRLK